MKPVLTGGSSVTLKFQSWNDPHKLCFAVFKKKTTLRPTIVPFLFNYLNQIPEYFKMNARILGLLMRV